MSENSYMEKFCPHRRSCRIKCPSAENIYFKACVAYISTNHEKKSILYILVQKPWNDIDDEKRKLKPSHFKKRFKKFL